MTETSTWFSPTLDGYLSGPLKGARLLCLVDGEHYPPVVGEAVRQLEGRGATVVGLLFIGGTEKVKDAKQELSEAAPNAQIFSGAETPEQSLKQLPDALRETDAEAVIDLSDEPVVDYGRRFRIASRALLEDIPYVGADFHFSPPPQLDLLSKPSLSIIGTGKRVGKTAVGAGIARLLDAEGMDPVVVCMGRGGPPDPHYVNARELTLNADTLLEVAESGGHAASDYWEDALLSGVPTIGCRRCGGGMGGTPVSSNVVEGAKMAEDGPHGFVVLEGSGATFAPVRTDQRIVVVGAGQPRENVLNYLGEYRLLTSDLAIVTMCEEPVAPEEKILALQEGILRIKPDIDIALTVFRPEPLGEVEDRRVFVATTAPEATARGIAHSIEEEYDCQVTGFSTNLSDRAALKEDLKEGLEDCDVLLTEIKAASIDVAARTARDKGTDIAFLHNSLSLVGGTVGDLESAILSLCREAEVEHL